MKLIINKDLNIDRSKINLLGQFCAFCVKHLPIKSDFKIYVVSSRLDHGIKTTALYDPNNKVCKVYAKNRSLVDVCRSIAHELTHMMQDEMGLLHGHIQDIGGFHEDQANAKAGELIKLFARENKNGKLIYEKKFRSKGHLL